MVKYILRGEQKLTGEAAVQGAKNSVLPLLAATLLHKGETILENVPQIKDVDSAIAILRTVGCTVTMTGNTVAVNAAPANKTEIPDNLMQEMRASVLFLGSLLARFGKASLTYPGGCAIGSRPIDIHMKAFKALGFSCKEEGSALHFSAENPCGAVVALPFASVGATENAMLLAASLKGTTKIKNAALEPEILDLQTLLNKMGARVQGACSPEICIEGVSTLNPCTHMVIPDRIVAATLLSAVCATGGDVLLKKLNPADLYAVLAALKRMGADISLQETSLRIQVTKPLQAINRITTLPYPGFPTDALPPLLAAACTGNGSVVFNETIFENRFKYVEELQRMGAKVQINERYAHVTGVKTLYGTEVTAADLRGGAALIVAALGANGSTKISGVEHIERGYEKIDTVLQGLGAEIRREE